MTSSTFCLGAKYSNTKFHSVPTNLLNNKLNLGGTFFFYALFFLFFALGTILRYKRESSDSLVFIISFELLLSKRDFLSSSKTCQVFFTLRPSPLLFLITSSLLSHFVFYFLVFYLLPLSVVYSSSSSLIYSLFSHVSYSFLLPLPFPIASFYFLCSISFSFFLSIVSSFSSSLLFFLLLL